jgi:glucose-6-phosphate 1-dehydrogenase
VPDHIDHIDHEANADRSDALVMFGLTGDLGRKKLFPAIYELAAAGRMDGPVIGVGRSDRTDAELREMFEDALADHEPAGGGDVDPAVTRSVNLSYIAGDSTEQAVYDTLATRLAACRRPLVYAALPPDLFGAVASGIAAADLPDSTRLVVEKPFGDGADSARELYDDITASIGPERLFIVDHFLAKAAIENMLIVRAVNPLLGNSLDATHVDAIDLIMHESGGVDGRGSFYEGVGAIEDVVQNHLLQMLAMVTMEPPTDDSDEAHHEARRALLAAIQPVRPDDVVLGQYAGYRDLDDVDDDSTVETFVWLALSIDNDRWRGVPISVRTGKSLREDRTEAIFHLRNTSPHHSNHGNRVRFSVKPHASVSFDLDVMDPATHEPRPTTVVACGPADHGELGDYAVMFDNAMRGETRHFAQIDGIVEAWRVLGPLLDERPPLHEYEPGSSGPSASPFDA